MRKTNCLILFTILALAGSTATAQEVQDATIAAPGAHQVEFENDHVRVISGLASPGHKSPMHSHPAAVIVSFGTARIKLTNADGTGGIVNMRPGSVFWSDGTAHEWELLGGEINAMAVEIKALSQADESADDDGEGTESGGSEGIQDATIAAPGAHQVEFENDHVRVISAIASAGHKSPMHSHPPLVAISIDTARIKLTNADGTGGIVNLRPGTVWWVDGAHEWELLAGQVNVIGVEVKAAQAPPQAPSGQ